MHPPDQAKHNKPSLDANGRLEVIFYDVLCIDQAKNRRWRLNYSRLPPDCPIGCRSGKSALLSSFQKGAFCLTEDPPDTT